MKFHRQKRQCAQHDAKYFTLKQNSPWCGVLLKLLDYDRDNFQNNGKCTITIFKRKLPKLLIT